MLVLKKLLNGEWVNTEDVEKYFNISFADGMKLFEFSRTAEWNQLPLEGQKITTKFRLKNEELMLYKTLGTVEELAEIQTSYFILDQKVRQYEKIGTVNELQQLKEKYTKKKPILSKLSTRKRKLYICPNCFNQCLSKEANERQDNMFCWDCGQAIDWSEVK